MEPLSRRVFLKLAGSAGLSLLLPGLSDAAARSRGGERPRSLVVVWLAGGPSQRETWDPVAEFGISTKIEGLRIAKLYPRVAELVHHLNVVRSLVSKEGDHERATYYLKTGYRPDPTVKHPALSAVIAQQTPRDELLIPQHVSVGEGQWPARGGFLGDEHDAFRVHDPQNALANMRRNVAEERLHRRLGALAVVEDAFRKGRGVQAERTQHGPNTRRALAMMGSKELEAFEIFREPDGIRRAYGENGFGRGCLMARRLVEAGVRAVEVSLDGFDSHVNNMDVHRRLAGELDPALAALIADLVDRDLLESTVLLVIGEFGRTPRMNRLEGRDHWPQGFSALIGGGGLVAGRVIGATDPLDEKEAPDRPVNVNDVHATVLWVVGLDPRKELITPVGRPLKLSDGKPMVELIAQPAQGAQRPR